MVEWETVLSCGGVDVRMRHEISNVLESGVAFETAQNVAACRIVICLMMQARLAARKGLVTKRAPVVTSGVTGAIGGAGSATYLTK